MARATRSGGQGLHASPEPPRPRFASPAPDGSGDPGPRGSTVGRECVRGSRLTRPSRPPASRFLHPPRRFGVRASQVSTPYSLKPPGVPRVHSRIVRASPLEIPEAAEENSRASLEEREFSPISGRNRPAVAQTIIARARPGDCHCAGRGCGGEKVRGVTTSAVLSAPRSTLRRSCRPSSDVRMSWRGLLIARSRSIHRRGGDQGPDGDIVRRARDAFGGALRLRGSGRELAARAGGSRSRRPRA